MRFTKQVAEGWVNVRSYVLAEVEAPESYQFACQEEGKEAEDGEPLAVDPETCQCEGCRNVRAVFAAIEWVDAQVSKRRRPS